jgi:hypothetical protein
MNEQDTEKKLKELLALLHHKSITYTETKFANGDGFVEHHMRVIRQRSGGAWDNAVASERIKEIENNIQFS